MDINDLILVSVDDHIVEPPGFLEPHLPAKYRKVAPKVRGTRSNSLADLMTKATSTG